jgi:hypothetical protein
MTAADHNNIIHDYNTTENGHRFYGPPNRTNYATNIFTAGVENERLVEVRLYVDVAPHRYRIFFTNNFTGSVQITEPIATLNAEFVGYHTVSIPVPNQPIIQAGTRFAITVEHDTMSVPVSRGIRATAPLSGRSFVGSVSNPLERDMSTTSIGAPHIKAVTSTTAAPSTFAVNISGTATAQTALRPSSPVAASEMVTVTVVAPIGQRFTATAGATIPVTATGVANFNLIISADRLTATGTFTMPANVVDLVVNATFEPITYLVTRG